MKTTETKQTQLSGRGALDRLKKFMPVAEFNVLKSALRGEERDGFADMLRGMAARVGAMPLTYQQDGKGDAAMVYLHYFTPASDWYITEKDVDVETLQAYGYAMLNGDRINAEMGYISIDELISNGAELDLHFTPRSLGAIKEKGETK